MDGLDLFSAFEETEITAAPLGTTGTAATSVSGSKRRTPSAPAPAPAAGPSAAAQPVVKKRRVGAADAAATSTPAAAADSATESDVTGAGAAEAPSAAPKETPLQPDPSSKSVTHATVVPLDDAGADTGAGGGAGAGASAGADGRGAVDSNRSTTVGLTVQQAVKPAKEYPFELDPFQKQSVACLERNESVLVSAHTSAGKTVVAEYAIAMSLRDKQRVIYTSPIKALSNQKYRDLYEEFGDVGLMTGDVTISPNASCLVMTTEILRSMLYRGSEVLREVAWVIYDEIHYMRDKDRGVVWEESIALLPHKVRFVFLSATIPNAKEFAAWIAKIHHQTCHVVYTDYRPTPLQHYMFPSGGDGLHLVVDEKGRFREDNFQKAMASLNAVTVESGLGGASSGGKKGRKGRGKGGKRGPSDLFRIVKMIMERNYDPVIVFSFSKRECESYAMQMSKLDFTNDDEKRLISEVFTNAIDSLSDDDKSLPQVDSILPLLKRGVGIHHGGLLPILKEVIEIMFQESLIKCLFATETFSMGINMPAKTVVFTATRKFDGRDFRWVSAGEYIQMSGRAGRRGLDDRGIVIQMVDEKMDPTSAKEMLRGQADPLNSTFHLGYNMLLNLMRVEGSDPEHLMALSFFQFQNEKRAPALQAALDEKEAEIKAMVIKQEKDVAQLYTLSKHMDRIRNEMREIINQPQHILKFIQPGRLAFVKDGDTDWGLGVVLSFQKRGATQDVSMSREAGGARFVVDMLLRCKPRRSKREPPKPADPSDTDAQLQVVPVMLPLLNGVSSVRTFLPPDVRTDKARAAVWKTVQEVQRRFNGPLPLLDPIEDLGISDERFTDLVAKAASLQSRLVANALHNAGDRDELFKLYSLKMDKQAEARHLKKELKATKNLLMKDQLKRMKRVLRRLGHTNTENVVQLKGRVAAEINTADELLTTELIFNGVFNDLTPAQCAALLSCLVFSEKGAEGGDDGLPNHLATPLRQLQAAARRVATVMQECKITVDTEEYVQSFHPDMMEVVYSWVQGARFVEICNMTTAFEGTVIRVIRRLEELVRQLADVSKVIGDAALEEKFTEASAKIKRDIIFAASLYL